MNKLLLLLSLSLALALPAATGYGQQGEEADAASQNAPVADAAPAAEGAPAADGEQQARFEQLTRDRTALQQTAENLRDEFGVYSPNLIEIYTDLGSLQAELGDHEQAVATYNDALQLVRINEGLYSEQQLSLIESMIESHKETGNWTRADDLSHLSFHIASRSFEPGSDRYLAAAEQFGDWRLRMIRENRLQQGSRGRLRAAEDLSEFYNDILDEIASQEAVDPASKVPLLYGKTQADIVIASAVAAVPYTAFTGTERRYITQTRCRNVTNAQGQVVRECYQVRLENPRYRQSQRQAKRNAINRYERQVDRSIEEMQFIKDSEQALSAAEVAQLDARIMELQSAAQQLRRNSRRPFGFEW